VWKHRWCPRNVKKFWGESLSWELVWKVICKSVLCEQLPATW